MRVHALLCWFDESPSWLAETVASCGRFCDRIIACDGRYTLYPNHRGPASGVEQADTILRAARGSGIASTIHIPNEPYDGNEVEKRSLLFRLADTDAGPDDWYFVIDGDEVVTHTAADIRTTLARLGEDTADVGLYWADDRHATQLGTLAEQTHEIRDGFTPTRRLYRARGIRVEGAHNVYITEDGRHLNGRSDLHQLEPAAQLTQHVRMEHRHAFRGIARQQDYAQYLGLRDNLGVERLLEYEMAGVDGKPTRIARR